MSGRVAAAVIRRAQRSDESELLRFDEHGSEPARQSFVRDALERGHCWVAEVHKQAVGYAVADTSFFGQTFVWLVVVAPEFRRRGIATALIRHIESTVEGTRLFTSTNESNTASQRLMESLGFRRSGSIENLDEGDPEIVYFKRLERG